MVRGNELDLTNWTGATDPLVEDARGFGSRALGGLLLVAGAVALGIGGGVSRAAPADMTTNAGENLFATEAAPRANLHLMPVVGPFVQQMGALAANLIESSDVVVSDEDATLRAALLGDAAPSEQADGPE